MDRPARHRPAIGGHTLTEDEYLATENKYLYAFEAFAHESGVTPEGSGPGPRHPRTLARLARATVTLDEAVELVRVILREGPLNTRLEDDDRFYAHVGDNMYMWLGSQVDCVFAVAETERIGLFVERDITSPMTPDPADRYWWLDEGAPVHHRLGAFARDDGRPLDEWDIADERMPLIRQLFTPLPGDDAFYETYEVDEIRLARVGEILGVELDPGNAYSIFSYTA